MEIIINNNNIAAAVIKFKEIYADATFENNRMIFSKNGLSLAFTVANVSENNGTYLAEMYFETSHPYFDHPFTDVGTGTGKTEEEAVKKATENFCETVIGSFITALDPETSKIKISSFYGEKEHIFFTPSQKATLLTGTRVSGTRDLFSVIADELPDYLGNKKTYNINLYVSCNNNNVISEVSINGMISKDLSDILDEYAHSWSSLKDFHSEKTHFLLIQDESTYIPPYCTYQNIEELTYKAIDVLRSAENIADALKSVLRICGELTLTFELTFFIPEILCQKVFRLNEKDTLFFKKNNETLKAVKSQVTNYGHISRAVDKYLSEKTITKENITQILRFSSKHSALLNAVSNGSKIEDLAFSHQMFNVPDSFELR